MNLLITVLDSAYLPQAVTLHQSLVKHARDWNLVFVCCDELAIDALRKLDLTSSQVTDVEEVLTGEHRSIRNLRSPVEFIWTLTPRVVQWAKEAHPYANSVTYIDADMYLLRSLSPFFAELQMSGKATLLTPHAFTPRLDYSNVSGKYCVQFQCFTGDMSNVILDKWNSQCLNWCGSRPEPGLFGDQMYLDNWLHDYPDSVGVVENPGWFLAPWNVERFPWSDAMFYHFHSLRIVGRNRASLGNYVIPRSVRKNVYGSYLSDLRGSCDALVGEIGVEPWIRTTSPLDKLVGRMRLVKSQIRELVTIVKQVERF